MARLLKNRNAAYAFSLTELVRFHSFEVGLGLHPDVQRVNVSVHFSTFPVEERFYLLRSFKRPIL